MDSNAVIGISIIALLLSCAGIVFAVAQEPINGINGLNGINGINGTIGLNGTNGINFNSTIPYTYLFNGSQGIQGLNGVTPNSTTYYVNNTSVTGGTVFNGSISDLYYYNNMVMGWSEGNSALPLTVYYNFSGVVDFSQFIIREYYLGSQSHNMGIQIYEYSTSSWQNYFSFTGQSGYNVLTIPCFDSSEHIQNGLVQIRLIHLENGIITHKLYVDFVWLVAGLNVGASTNLVGYAQYNFSYNNFNGNGNFTTTDTLNTNKLIINSTFLVNNLNSDLLDGQHGTYYSKALNIRYIPIGLGGLIALNSVFGTSYGGYYPLSGTTDTSSIECTFTPPSDWVTGTNFTVNIWVVSPNAGNMRVQIYSDSASVGDSYSNLGLVNQVFTYTLITNPTLNLITVNLNGASININENIWFFFQRLGADVLDTITGNIDVRGFSISYTSSS